MMIQYRDRKPLFGVSSPASQASAALKCIVESLSLLRDLKQIALAVQTFSLESFHSVLIHFTPKSNACTQDAVKAMRVI